MKFNKKYNILSRVAEVCRKLPSIEKRLFDIEMDLHLDTPATRAYYKRAQYEAQQKYDKQIRELLEILPEGWLVDDKDFHWIAVSPDGEWLTFSMRDPYVTAEDLLKTYDKIKKKKAECQHHTISRVTRICTNCNEKVS